MTITVPREVEKIIEKRGQGKDAVHSTREQQKA